MARSLYFLRTAKNVLNYKALKSVYYSLIHSHLIYGIQVWSCSLVSNIKPLILKQKQAIRIINNSSYNSHTEPLFKACKILPLLSLIDFFKLQFMQQFSQGFLPISFNDTWVTNAIRLFGQDHITLRNENELLVPFARLTSTSIFPLTSFPKLWHNFPDERIKFIRCKNEFNMELKAYFFNLLPSTANCQRLFCPACIPIHHN